MSPDPGYENIEHPAGSTFDLQYYAGLSGVQGSQSLHMTIASNTDYVQQSASLTCNPAVHCGPGLEMPSYFSNYKVDKAICINFGPGLPGYGEFKYPIFTLHYKSLQTASLIHEGYPHSSIVTAYVWSHSKCGETATPSSCTNTNYTPIFSGPDGDTDDAYLDQYCRLGRTDPGEGSTLPNGTPVGNGDNSTDTAQNATKSKGRSGSGSANSATTQSDQSNTVPSTGNQGDTNQASLTPSPFYDGKQYAAGSDSKEVFGTVTVAGRTLQGFWLIAILVIFAATACALYIWRRVISRLIKNISIRQ